MASNNADTATSNETSISPFDVILKELPLPRIASKEPSSIEDIHITSWEDNTDGVTEYTCTSRLLDGAIVTQRHRFSDFLRLHILLGGNETNFPVEKVLFVTKRVRNQRVLDLETYLRRYLPRGNGRNAASLRDFLLGPTGSETLWYSPPTRSLASPRRPPKTAAGLAKEELATTSSCTLPMPTRLQ